jgi:hypothetical protein
MRTVFALQFDIQPTEGTTASACLEEVDALLVNWIANK